MKFLFALTICACVKGEVVLIDQPRDFYVRVGATAMFNCSYTGTNGAPWWRIDGTLHASSQLPLRHEYQSQILFVRDVRVSDNTSTYQCLFGSEVSSTVGRLYCYYEVETNFSLATATLDGTSYEKTTTRDDIMLFIKDSTNIGPTTATTSQDNNASNDTVKTRFIIIYGVIGGVCVLFIVAIITAIVLLRKCHKYQQEREKDTGNLKSLELDINPSYEHTTLRHECDSKKVEEEPHYECVH